MLVSLPSEFQFCRDSWKNGTLNMQWKISVGFFPCTIFSDFIVSDLLFHIFKTKQKSLPNSPPLLIISWACNMMRPSETLRWCVCPLVALKPFENIYTLLLTCSMWNSQFSTLIYIIWINCWSLVFGMNVCICQSALLESSGHGLYSV